VITAKLENGNIKAAIRILSSEEGPVTPSENSFSSLKSKHPTASKPCDGLPNPSQFSSLSVTESDVRRAVLSFPSGFAGGPDGL